MTQNTPTVTLPELPEDFPEFDTATALKVWDALVNPPEYADEIDPEEYEDYGGYPGLDDVSEFDTVALRMEAREDLFPLLNHSILSTVDGVIDAYEVGVYHGPTSTYLMHFMERKHGVYDRNATGAAAALSYGLAIASVYEEKFPLLSRLGSQA